MHASTVRRVRTTAAIAAIAAAASAVGCTDDSSPLNVVPSTPSTHEALGGGPQTAQVGTRLPDPVTVRVKDRYGNPVPGVPVAFTVTAGGGSIDPESDTTDVSGELSAEWTLGETVGENTVTAEIDGLETIVFTAAGTPGPPASVNRLAGHAQTDTVTRQLADSIVAEVVDRYGNVVPGATVEWSPADATAGVTETMSTTDDDGLAAVLWTLGEVSGEKRLEARAGSTAAATFAATAEPDAPVGIAKDGGDGQAGTAGSELVDPLVAKVVDPYGNGVGGVAVDWSVVSGGGSLDSATVVSDSLGRSAVRYTLGTTPGPESVRADAGALGQVVFDVQAGDANNIYIDGLYVTQAAQAYDGSVPLVAGRAGLLRIFVRADTANVYTPDVEVRLYDGPTLIRTDTLSAQEDSVRTVSDEGSLTYSWNMDLPASLIRPGLGIVAVVDPDNRVYEADEGDNTFPAAGAPGTLDVRALHDFQLRFVPIHVPANGTTGNVHSGNIASYMTVAEDLFPVPGWDADLHDTFTTSAGGIETEEQWSTILSEIRSLRVDEGSARYYYGVLASAPDAAWCGLGYIGYGAAIGLETCGASTAAHEWGHNFGRTHAPCGGPANPDPSYPYPNASIGIWGVNADDGSLKSPNTYHDIMSYCGPAWISDYTYDAVLWYRDGEAASPQAAFAAAPEPTLIVWGRVRDGRLILEPAYEAMTTPSLPETDGPYRIEATADDGGTLFSFSFAGTRVGHGAGDDRHFAFAVPVEPATLDRLRSVRLTGPGAAPARVERTAGAPDARVDLTATPLGGGRVRVAWNAAAFPMAVVRNAATGRILSFARGGSAVVRTGATELDVTMASGIGGPRGRVRVR